MKLSFSNFLEKVFGSNNPFKRNELGLIHNTIKWLALRAAYALYRLNISANALDIFGFIILFPAYVLLFFSIIEMNMTFFILGYSIIAFVIFIDFVDGPLSKVSKYKCIVGDNLDNLCPDIIKFLSNIFLGFLTQNEFLFILSILVSIIISRYISITSQAITNKDSMLLKIFVHKMSLNGFRIFVCFLIPLISVLYLFGYDISILAARVLVIFFYVSCILWIFLSFKQKSKKYENNVI